jgi:2-succinyl-5-enolpyruvyl-6-hydroxy-3-cyclohexene-1-carboxylate synthase
MEKYYSIERNVQILVQLLKDYGIKKCIASPGTVNIPFVGSIQNDDWFEVYSCVDERSAGYMACGLSEESGEPVVITCTGATASRNYLSSLTEAYYRKIKIVVVTATPPLSWEGHNMAQYIDRTVSPKDIKLGSYILQQVKDSEDEWDCEIKVNRGLQDLFSEGGGPVHFNLVTTNTFDFSVREIKPVRKITKYTVNDTLPELPSGNIGIFIASHHKFGEELTKLVDKFCFENNAVVLSDHTSGYYGKYKLMPAIISGQSYLKDIDVYFDLIIHIGEVSGDYYTQSLVGKSKEVWRVSEDGKLKDTFQKLTKVFDMQEEVFFRKVPSRNLCNSNLFDTLKQVTIRLRESIPEDLPFSNIWIAKTISSEIPTNSVCHIGILNTLRSWNFFELPQSVYSYCNVGGFGIDGNLSSLIGASFNCKDKLFYGFFGDLSFFYDINSVANRHVGNNVRIMLLNNGKGIEFRNNGHPAALWGDEADKYFAAGGHFGNKSTSLIKNYAENLGFKYLSASCKTDFLSSKEEFLNPKIDKAIIFEVFLETTDETEALSVVTSLVKNNSIRKKLSDLAHTILSDDSIRRIKQVIS